MEAEANRADRLDPPEAAEHKLNGVEFTLLYYLSMGMSNLQASHKMTLPYEKVQKIKNGIITKFWSEDENRHTQAVREACLAKATSYCVNNNLFPTDHLPRIPANLFSDFEIEMCEDLHRGINVFDLAKKKGMDSDELKNIFNSMREKAKVATNLMLVAAWVKDRDEIMRARHGG